MTKAAAAAWQTASLRHGKDHPSPATEVARANAAGNDIMTRGQGAVSTLSSSITIAAQTDIGCVRSNNEDCYAFEQGRCLAAVCDGMGGMAAGEVASKLAAETFLATFIEHPETTPLELRLALAIRAANDAVYACAQESSLSMGTTLVAAAIEHGQLLIGNVGDSRAYLVRGGACMQLSVDHSYLSEVLRSGRVQLEDLNSIDRQRFEALITRAVGVGGDVEPDFFSLDLVSGDLILLTTDGLTRYFGCDDIAPMVSEDLDASCHALIAAAKARGGVDNITCLLMHYEASAADDAAPAAEAQPEAAA
jgi:serine/threonine protein phosphatase PrpC